MAFRTRKVVVQAWRILAGALCRGVLGDFPTSLSMICTMLRAYVSSVLNNGKLSSIEVESHSCAV